MAKSSGTEGTILHFGSTRLRVTGSGNLKQTLSSLGAVKISNLADISLAPITDIEPLRYANLTTQRAQVQIRTTQINEVFLISKITVYIKPVANAFPQ